MLNRQKILIQLMRSADRPVSRLELTKWSFLLRHDSPSGGGPSFYDFVPYHYGPFSFALYQELDKLEEASYVQRHGESSCVLDEDVARAVRIADNRVGGDIRRLIERFKNHNTEQLIDYVYGSYPAYTCNSRIRRCAKRPSAQPAVYTAGYEGRSVDSFLNLLVENGIRRLIDVRRNPIARRYGFHRSTLMRLCNRVDIDYIHFPNLGIPSEKRRSLETESDYRELFADYEKDTLREQATSISDVCSLVSQLPSVLVCMESDPKFCHRSALASQVSRISKLPIRNLGCCHERRED